jgi:hypothetical protein
MTIDKLDDDSLLYIFYLYVDKSYRAWYTLVYVCQRWRTLVFGSPRYLNLQLFCTENIQAKKMLDIWPALTIVIRYYGPPGSGVDKIFAALGAQQLATFNHHLRVGSKFGIGKSCGNDAGLISSANGSSQARTCLER